MDANSKIRLQDVARRFEEAGGCFLTPVTDIAQRFAACRAIVFDWDGVFNSGVKAANAGSGFSEPDSMGTNLLRYGLWRQRRELPPVAIISGEINASAIEFARREHFSAAQTGIADKRRAIEAFCQRHELAPDQLACVFDDVNDLSMASVCGLRLMVGRVSTPMLAEHVAKRSLCDYRTGQGGYPVREVCELLLGIMGVYDAVVDSRVAFDEEYQDYWRARQSAATETADLPGPVGAIAQDAAPGRRSRGRL